MGHVYACEGDNLQNITETKVQISGYYILNELKITRRKTNLCIIEGTIVIQ